MQSVKVLIKSHPFYVLGFIGLILYVSLRAAYVNLTHDEAWSFHNINKFWHVEFLCSGNSHWFNSLAMKISILLGSENIFWLRWFSIFSFIITCGTGLLLLKLFENNSIKLFAFCIIFLNPYLLDFFGMARGYAGGIMFQCLALVFFIKGLNNKKRITFFMALLFSGLSAIANYSFVYFYFAFCVIYFFTQYFRTGRSFLRNKFFYFDLLFSLGIAALIIRAFIFILKCSGDVVGAGEPSFLKMFNVFWDGLTYYKLSYSQGAQSILSILVFSLIAVSLYIGIFRKRSHHSDLYFYTASILAIMIFTMVFNFFGFGVVFPFYRSAQLLFIPSFVSIIGLLNYFIQRKKAFIPIVNALSFLLIINFAFSANLKFCFDFKEQAECGICFNLVKDLNAKHVGISPELYGVFYNYHQSSSTKKYPFLGESINTHFPKGKAKKGDKLSEFDYLILYPPYNLTYYHNTKISVSPVYLSPVTKTLILRVEKKPRSNNTPGLHKQN